VKPLIIDPVSLKEALARALPDFQKDKLIQLVHSLQRDGWTFSRTGYNNPNRELEIARRMREAAAEVAEGRGGQPTPTSEAIRELSVVKIVDAYEW
jgi:hypothetical protein